MNKIKTGIKSNHALAYLSFVVLCLFALQSAATLSGSVRGHTPVLATTSGHDVLKHNTNELKPHLSSFPESREDKGVHFSNRFRYHAKCFYSTAGDSFVQELSTVLPFGRFLSLYKSISLRPAYYNFLFRYTPF